jgi:hypothetical protein
MSWSQLRVAILAALLTQSCRDAPAVRAPQTLQELAEAWSGGRTDPTCQTRGPHGEYLGALPGATYCQWPTVARGSEWSIVGGHRNSVLGLTDIVWERRVRRHDSAVTLADSLGKELRSQGLREQLCARGGRRWETATLGILLTVYPARSDGAVIVTVFATTMPRALPRVDCPATTTPRSATT